ncbi:MAG TPA: hypothetical protein VNX00_14225 [Herbaspirillum sp.]|jgi:hypothetical protein|nr:hypothetical protein [Herbaspirillum sp.]
MKNTPEDQLSLDFEKSLMAPSEFKNSLVTAQNLKLVYSRLECEPTSSQTGREKTLSEVLSFARSLKW